MEESINWENKQDRLFMEHPEEIDRIYQFLWRIKGREPKPAEVVSRFRFEKENKDEKRRELEEDPNAV